MSIMKLPILYKRSNSQNHINQWEIEVEGNKFRSTTGFVGMKMFTGDWTECVAKNIGKKNATTSEEQALAEATSIHTKRKSLGYWEDIKDCDKKVYFAPMRAHNYMDRKNKITLPIMSQPKLDGVRCIVKADGMWTRTGKPLISAPHIFEQLEQVFTHYPEAIIDGELYTSNENVDFNTIISCVRKTKPTAADLELSKQYIELHVYDLPTSVGEDEDFQDRYFNLCTIYDAFDFHGNIQLVPTYTLLTVEEIDTQLDEYLKLGFEGQMLRDPESKYQNKKSTGLLKHKIFDDAEYECVGYAEGIGKYSGKIATLTVNNDGVEVSCTVNGTMDFLTELFENKDKLVGQPITVKYFGVTPDGSLRFPKVIAIRDYE